MVTAWSSSQSSDWKRGAPPKSSPKLMRIYGLDPPDKTTHQPSEQKPGQQAPPHRSLHHSHSWNTNCLTLHSYFIFDRYSKAICRLQEWLTLTLEWGPDGEQGLQSHSFADQPLSLPDGPPRPPCASSGLPPALQKDRHTPWPVMWYGTPAAAAQSWVFFLVFANEGGGAKMSAMNKVDRLLVET